MRHPRVTLGASLAVVLLACSAFAEEKLKSGPQPGAFIGVFHPYNVNGPAAGQKACQV
jgi:hypothetical protein